MVVEFYISRCNECRFNRYYNCTSTIDAQGNVTIADKIIHTGDTNTALRFPAADTFSMKLLVMKDFASTQVDEIGLGKYTCTTTGRGLHINGTDQTRIKLTNLIVESYRK